MILETRLPLRLMGCVLLFVGAMVGRVSTQELNFGAVNSPSSAIFASNGSGTSIDGIERPRVLIPTHRIETTLHFCVRSCDGRYFPAPSSTEKISRAIACKNLCPASDAKLFSGTTIEDAESADGKRYTKQANAFRFRNEIVQNCSCNGKGSGGLATIPLEKDATLRKGDLVANAQGRLVSSASFIAANRSAANLVTSKR